MALETKILKRKDYVYVVELIGSIDTETHSQLEEELKEIINEQTRALIFDMKGIDYISSIGIKVILDTKRQSEQRQATFSMVNLQPQIRKVLNVMKILPMIDIFEDMEEADKYIDQIIKEEIGRQTA